MRSTTTITIFLFVQATLFHVLVKQNAYLWSLASRLKRDTACFWGWTLSRGNGFMRSYRIASSETFVYTIYFFL